MKKAGNKDGELDKSKKINCQYKTEDGNSIRILKSF